MRRVVITFILLLMLAPCAQAARTYRTWADDTIKLYSPREQDWTYVTPENYEENMELITSHGFDEKDARKRYESGEIIFEAYHTKALEDGCLRLQVIETPYTREIWDHTSLAAKDDRSYWMIWLRTGRICRSTSAHRATGRGTVAVRITMLILVLQACRRIPMRAAD